MNRTERPLRTLLFAALLIFLVVDLATAAAPGRKKTGGAAPRVSRRGDASGPPESAPPIPVGKPTPISHASGHPTTGAIMDEERRHPPAIPATPETKPELPYPDRKGLPQNPVSPHASSISDPLAPKSAQLTAQPLFAQTVGTNFTGATLSGTNPTFAFPPDSMGAVGPTQYFVVVNNRMVTFDKSTGVADGVLNVTTDSFFSSVRGGSSTSDPRVRYDRLSGRWFVIIINVAYTNRILLAWTDDASQGIITANTVWSFAWFYNGGGTGCLADYPTLGIDANALYIGTNLFCGGYYYAYQGTDGYVIGKAGLLAGSGTVTRFALAAPAGAAGPFTPQGVDNYDPSATEGYFIGVDNVSFGLMQLRRVFNPGGSAPTISGNIPITVPATMTPMTVPHAGNTGGVYGNLDAIDDRLFAAHIRDGRLWTAHNITVDTSGVATSSTTTGRDGVRWYEFNGIRSSDNGGVPTVVQSGTLYDNTANVSAARFFSIPSVMVSGQGHAALGFSTAGTPNHIDAAVTGRWKGDTLGTLQPWGAYTASSTAYNPPGDSGSYYYGRRWGDYSYTSLDPLDDMTMWTIQEFCDATNSYGVRIAKLIAPPPPTPASSSPGTVAGGLASTSVTITATAVGLQAFYDPGPDLAAPAVPFHHITAAVGGGVVVNGATLVDATHVTLDLNTVGAPANTVDVTIINPDGQSATGTGVLTIGAGGNPAPQITCPADFSVNTATNAPACNTTVTFSGAHAATATGFPVPTITYSPASGSTFPVGIQQVTATATNTVGVTTCAFNVTVVDKAKPTITCPASVTVVAPYGSTSAVVNLPVSAADNCGTPTIVSSPASGSSFPLGTTTVTSTATDGAGNSASCSFPVTVITGNALFLVTPCRLIDTRNANGPYGGPSLAPGERRNFMVAGQCGIPADAKSVAANITAIQTAAGGWLTAYPGPTGSALPFVSSINYNTGSTRANNAVILLGPDGSINVFNSGPASAAFVLDLSGYFK